MIDHRFRLLVNVRFIEELYKKYEKNLLVAKRRQAHSQIHHCFANMAFSEEDTILTKCLREEMRYSARRFLAEFPDENRTRGHLDRLRRKIDQFGTVGTFVPN